MSDSRKIFYIDVNDLPPEDAKNFVKEEIKKFKTPIDKLGIFYIGVGDLPTSTARAHMENVTKLCKDIFQRHGWDVIFMAERGTYHSRFERVS